MKKRTCCSGSSRDCWLFGSSRKYFATYLCYAAGLTSTRPDLGGDSTQSPKGNVQSIGSAFKSIHGSATHSSGSLLSASPPHNFSMFLLSSFSGLPSQNALERPERLPCRLGLLLRHCCGRPLSRLRRRRFGRLRVAQTGHQPLRRWPLGGHGGHPDELLRLRRHPIGR